MELPNLRETWIEEEHDPWSDDILFNLQKQHLLQQESINAANDSYSWKLRFVLGEKWQQFSVQLSLIVTMIGSVRPNFTICSGKY